jgi:putative flippase GtrA
MDVVLRPQDVVTAETSGNLVLLATVPVSEDLLRRAIEPMLRDDIDISVVDSRQSAPSVFTRPRCQVSTEVNALLPEVIAVRREFYDSCCSVAGAAPSAIEILSQADGPGQVQFVRSQEVKPVGRSTMAARLICRITHWKALLESRFPGSARLLKFGCVGASGVIVDLSVLALGLQFGVPSGLAAILAIWIAMSWNFVLNRKFTFASPHQGPALQQYRGFCLSCLLGASANWSVRVALLSLGGVFEASPYLVSLVGIIAGTGFNFCLCSRFVFHRTNRRRHELSDRSAESNAASERIESESNRQEHVVSQPGWQSGPRRGLLQALVVISAVLGATWAISGEPASSPRKPEVEQAADAKPAGSNVEIPADDVRDRISDGANRKSAGLSLELAEVTPLPRPVIPDKKKNDDPPIVLERDFSDSAVETRLKEMASFLADDRLQGRGVNTYGLDLAADYIGDQFKKCGLDTEHYASGPFQEFRLYSLGNEGAVQQLSLLDEDGDPASLTLGTDYTSIMSARAGRTELPVVFAGFGITAPSISYDDYADLDAEGAAVIVLRHGPPVLLEGDEELSRHTWIRTKIRNAVEHGARAVLFCNDLSEIARVQNDLKLDPEKSEPLLRAELTPDTAEDAVPSVHCRRSVLKAFIGKAGFDLDEVEKSIVADSKPGSSQLGELRISALVSRVRTGRKLRNVLGLIEGKGEVADETIVLGAHYDHLGRGGWGSLSLGANQQIHNGADDNASGTSILVEVARQLVARKEPLRRTVLFIAFSGEELGLIGSKRYVRDPLIPINQTVAMLNLDMVGRLRKDLLTVYGTGTSPMWVPMLQAKSKPLNLKIASRPGGYGPSDHASFYEKGVPVLHFFTGFHPQYHRPSDDAELLNIEGMRRITSLVTDMIVEVSESNARPVRTRTQSGLTDLSPETLEAILSGQPARPRPVILGVSPKESRDGKGLVIESTVPRTPAARFGLRAGDVIIRVGATEVTTTRQLNELVQARKHGDTMQLQIRRNGILLELDVKL